MSFGGPPIIPPSTKVILVFFKLFSILIVVFGAIAFKSANKIEFLVLLSNFANFSDNPNASLGTKIEINNCELLTAFSKV